MKIFNRIISVILTVIMLVPTVGNTSVFAYKVTEAPFAIDPVTKAEYPGKYSYGNLTYDVVDGNAVIMRSTKASGNVVIPDTIDGYKVTEIADYAFYKCAGIERITIGNNVWRIGDYAFDFCINTEAVTIGSSVEEIGECAFRNCSFVNSLKLPKGIQRIGYGFIHGTDLFLTVKWTDNVLYIDNYLIEAKVNKISGSYKIRDGVTCIADAAFKGCGAITELIIPDSVTAIGISAFSGCSALEKVSIGKSVRYIHDYAFNACNALKSVSIPPSVLEIGYCAFAGVKCMDVDNGVYYLGNYLISADLDISGEVTVKQGTVGIAERAFCDCRSVTAVKLPSSLRSISSVAFSGTDALNMINIPASVTHIGGDAFKYGAKNLRVYIEDISAWCNISFANRDANPFRRNNSNMVDSYYGKAVTEVTIPEGTDSIGEYAFYNWTKLKKLTVPDSVKSIGYGAFEQKKKIDGTDVIITNESITLMCSADSYAYKYALENGIKIPVCQHSFTKYISNNDLSCTSDATETAVCDKGCGARDIRVVQKALGHRFIRYISNKDATCETDGTKTASCVNGCGESDTVADVGTKLEHIYGEYISDNNATCFSDGTMSAECIYGCGRTVSKAEEGTIRDHSYTVYTPDGNATCYMDGTKTAYCDYGCGRTDTLADEGSVTEHKYTSYIFNEDADCINDGTKTAFCDFGCGESETVIAEGSALGHSFGDWLITVEPTYDTAGSRFRVCSVCEEIEEEYIPVLTLPFTDVKENHWFASSVKYCVQKGYVTGMNPTTFAPNGNITRAQFLVMLAKLDGVDLSIYEGRDAGFADVKPSHWYNTYVCWAVEQKLTAGLTPTHFGPGANVTRAQLARFFYVYSEIKDINVEGRADISAFPDEGKVPAWAIDSISWAVDAGVIGGVKKNDVNYLEPNGTATRAQATVMFKAFDAFRK